MFMYSCLVQLRISETTEMTDKYLEDQCFPQKKEKEVFKRPKGQGKGRARLTGKTKFKFKP